jgi:phosphoglycolate phosphatase-like HAD superfamily hydrolase
MDMNIKNIIFDFDGVIIDSLSVREYGFRKIFEDFNDILVEKLIKYHTYNGGFSRFVKIKYFYNKILNKDIDESLIMNYANEYSKIMKKNLLGDDIIILETFDFIKNNYKTLNFHIASGSEEKELKFLNKSHNLDLYFKSIYGSPTSKIQNVFKILNENDYLKEETILIGDSINDYDAAKENQISFFGYNNKDLNDVSDYYISTFKNFNIKDFNEKLS